MSIVEVYVAGDRDAKRFRAVLFSLGSHAPVSVVTPGRMSLPAIRTAYNLYEGELVVGRFLQRLQDRSSSLSAAEVAV